MLKIKINFSDNTGSCALDVLATTFGGDWDPRSSTRNSGIITNVEEDNRYWVEKTLVEDNNVESYTITQQ